MPKRYQEMNKSQKIFLISIAFIVLTIVIASFFYTFPNRPEDGKLKIVASFYPLAFFAQQIGGEEVSVKQIIPNNIEAHNWQPTFADILALEEADVIIYNGASLDHWFEEDILPIIDPKRKIIVKTTEGLQLIETETENGDATHEHEEPFDPHTWISPYLAKQQAEKIYQALVEKNPSQTDYYTTRWQNLRTKFEELDNSYLTELSTKRKGEIFVAHSAFAYLADRYGFIQHGVIGISADEQPSASKYANLVTMMAADETYVVFVDPIYPNESAQTLKNELKRLTGHDVTILKLYFMLGDMDDLDYFGQQEKNLQNLIIGLDAK
jgi:zinc transport system substrate-binding protein